MTVDEALEFFRAAEARKLSGTAYKAGSVLLEAWPQRGGDVTAATSDDASDAALIAMLYSSLAELCAATGIAPIPGETGPEYVARVKASMERTGAAPSEGGDQDMGDIHLHLDDPGKYEISIRLQDESMAGRLDEIKTMLTQLPATIGGSIMSLRDDVRQEFTDLEAKVTTMSGAVDSTVVLLTDLRAMQSNAIEQGDLDRLRAIDEQFGGTIERLAAAVGAPGDGGSTA